MWRAHLLLACQLAAVAASGLAAAQPSNGSGDGAGGTASQGGAARQSLGTEGGLPAAGDSGGAAPGLTAPFMQGSRQVDVESLLALRDSVENWVEFSEGNGFRGWNQASPLCSWSGVTCSDDGTLLTMSWQCRACKVRAVGTLPAELGTLRTITTLDLQSNSFHGTLPPQWGDVDMWPQLQNLYLNDNNLTGTLPDEWGNPGAMPHLLQLRADSNRLTGTLPQNWGNEETAMRELGVIRLSNNSLEGTLPEQWGTPGAFTQLSVLALDRNQISGTLPQLWGAPAAMAFLQELYLQSNRLTGGLPSTWGSIDNFPRLRFLFVANNQLGGTLPAEWGRKKSFPVLKTLDMNNTGVYGTLPPEWGDVSAMAQLDAMRLERNDLSGSIPQEWLGFETLSRLIIKPGNPRLCGQPPPDLPFSLCDDRDLTCLRIPVDLNDTCGPILAPPRTPAAEADVSPAPGGATPGTAVEGAEVSPPAAASQAAPWDGGTSASAGGGGDSDGGGSGGGGPNVGAIVGGVVGGAVAAALVAALVALLLGRKRRKQEGTGRVEKYKPSVRPFISEEEEMELGGGGCAGGTIAVNWFAPPSPASPAAMASLPASSSTSKTHARTHASTDLCSESRTVSAASTPHRRPNSKSPPSAERRPSRVTSMLIGSGLLPTSSGSFLTGWCSDSRTASLELPPTPGVETELAAGGGRKVMAQIAEEGEGASSQAGKSRKQEESQEIGSPGRGDSSSLDSLGGDGGGGGGGGGGPGPMNRFLSTPLPWSDWEIRPEEFEIAKRPDGSDWLLGSGGFGKVYKAFRHGVQPVAVKIIPLKENRAHSDAAAEVQQEIGILRACRDVNIVQFVGAYIGLDQTMLVTEYMEGGDLMHNIAGGRVSWYRRGKKIALDVARGLVFLHARRIVHFDLKSPNILLARDGTAKIGDVGMAKIMNRDYITGVVSTLAWSAPEMLWNAKCTEKADIYSFGIILWEICGGDVPERGRLRDLRVPAECPPELRNLVLECLEPRPSIRPTALQLVERLSAIPATPPPGVVPPRPKLLLEGHQHQQQQGQEHEQQQGEDAPHQQPTAGALPVAGARAAVLPASQAGPAQQAAAVSERQAGAVTAMQAATQQAQAAAEAWPPPAGAATDPPVPELQAAPQQAVPEQVAAAAVIPHADAAAIPVPQASQPALHAENPRLEVGAAAVAEPAGPQQAEGLPQHAQQAQQQPQQRCEESEELQ